MSNSSINTLTDNLAQLKQIADPIASTMKASFDAQLEPFSRVTAK